MGYPLKKILASLPPGPRPPPPHFHRRGEAPGTKLYEMGPLHHETGYFIPGTAFPIAYPKLCLYNIVHKLQCLTVPR